MKMRKWKIGFRVALLTGFLTAGAGLVAGISWQAFVAVLCMALLTNLGSYLMKHPVETIEDDPPADEPLNRRND